MNLSTMARRNIFRNRRRSLLSAIAIAMSVLTMVIMFSFIQGMKRDMATQMRDYVTGEVRIQHKDYEKNEAMFPLNLSVGTLDATLGTIEAQEGVSVALPRTAFPGIYYQEDEQKPLLGWAVDLAREEKAGGFARTLTSGRLPTPGAKEILMGSSAAASLGMTTGDEISILYRTSRFSSNYITFTIAGLINTPLSSLNSRLFVVDRQDIAAKLFMEDSSTQILVRTADLPDERIKDVVATLSAALPGTLDVRLWEHVSSLYSFMGLAEIIYNIIGIFFYLLASSVIITTTMMVVFERIREIGTLSAMGMTGSEVLRLFFIEAFYIGVAGTLVGLVLGIGLVIPFSQVGIDLGAITEQTDFGISQIIYPNLSLSSLILVPLTALAVASIAALIPARRAVRIQPVEALRTWS